MAKAVTPINPLVKKGCHLCGCPSKSVFERSDDEDGIIQTHEAIYKIPTGTITVRERKKEDNSQKVELPPQTVNVTAQKKSSVSEVKHIETSMKSQISYSTGISLNRKWSGWTYITEIEEKKNEVKYQKECREALRKRKLYRRFKKMSQVHYSKLKSTNAGPEWFQDLSLKQMGLIDGLVSTLKADLEEGITSRTQRLLDDLGITPGISNKKIKRCITECNLDPLHFLFTVHKYVVDAEQEEYERKYFEAKQQGKHILAFSINERLLLSAVFHAHFPVLLKKLDKILPNPAEELIVRWAKKPQKKKKVYDSPYLEPLPINEKSWYEEEADREQYKEVMRKMKRQAMKRKNKQYKALEELETFGSVMKGAPPSPIRESKSLEEEFLAVDPVPPKSHGNITFTVHGPPDRKAGDTEKEEKGEYGTDTDEGKWIAAVVYMTKIVRSALGPTCFRTVSVQTKSKKGGFFSADMVLICDTEGDSSPDLRYGKRRGKQKPGQRSRPSSRKEVEIEDEARVCVSALAGSSEWRTLGAQTVPILEFEPLSLSPMLAPERKLSFGSEEFVWSGDLSDEVLGEENLRALEFKVGMNSNESLEGRTTEERAPFSDSVSIEGDMTGARDQEAYEASLVGDSYDNNFKTSSSSQSPIAKSTDQMKAEKPSVECAFSTKPYPVECPDETCELIEVEDLPLDEYTYARRNIRLLPPSKQLTAAVEFLCERGDPLAILPMMDKTPWLIRWYEKRRGLRLKLSKEDNKELMECSRRIWDSDYTKVSDFRIPLLPLSPEELEVLSWDKINKVKKMISETVYTMHRGVKQQLVDNARDLFPSMYPEYFKTNAIQKSFREIFFTYMPSREKDSWIFKPWKPHEKEIQEEE